MFARESKSTLIARAIAAFRSYLPGTDAQIWPNNLNVTATVMGELQDELMGRLDQVSKDAFLTTASWSGLVVQGGDLGLPPLAATNATGTATITATDVLAVADGALLQSLSGTVFYVSGASSLSAAGTLTVNIIAQMAGIAGNAAAGVALTLNSGFTGAGASTATCVVGAGGVTGGTDMEGVEAYRARLLFLKQNPYQAGAPSDYVNWGKAVPGVTRVFVERLYNGPGTVRVFVLFDDLFAATDGVADAAHVALADAAIRATAPGDAFLVVVAPQAQTINVAISNLYPNTAAVQAAVVVELADAFRRFGRVAGNDTAVAGMDYLATPFTFSANWIWQAISNAAGVKRFDMSMTADTTIAAGFVPVLGSVTFS